MRTRVLTSRIAAFLLLLLCCNSTATAQQINDGGAWFALLSQGDIKQAPNDRLKWWFDGHLRFFEDTDGFGQSIVRPGIGYRMDNWTLWQGYAWIRTEPASNDGIDEHRSWQQLTGSKEIGPYKFALRSRLEQRFVETGDDVGWRYRQFLRFQKKLSDRHLFVVWDELFFGLNDTDWGAEAGFDQNRVFVGFGMKSHRFTKLRTEIGYLYQHVSVPRGADVNNHLISINLFRSP